MSETEAIDFIKKYLTKEEFEKLKFKVFETSDSRVDINNFRFFITRNRLSGNEIVSFVFNEDKPIKEKGLFPGILNVLVEDTSPEHQGYFKQTLLKNKQSN